LNQQKKKKTNLTHIHTHIHKSKQQANNPPSAVLKERQTEPCVCLVAPWLHGSMAAGIL